MESNMKRWVKTIKLMNLKRYIINNYKIASYPRPGTHRRYNIKGTWAIFRYNVWAEENGYNHVDNEWL